LGETYGASASRKNAACHCCLEAVCSIAPIMALERNTFVLPAHAQKNGWRRGIAMQLCRRCGRAAPEVRRDSPDLPLDNFGDSRLYLERSLLMPDKLEVQIFGDSKGGVVALGERDCSLQRRSQKVVEETRRRT